MTERISLTVNGELKTIDADPDMPLLYALRNDLALDDPRFGCGLAQCGACTVHLDGNAVRSCVTPVGSVSGRQVTTIAGLASDTALHPVQQAFIDEQVPQCGYCLSGWVMTAAAFLDSNPDPTDTEIRQALAGLKCRCGTHMAIMRAVRKAAAMMRG